MRFVALTTHQYGRRNSECVHRLVRSIDAQQLKTGDSLTHLVLLQGVSEIPDEFRQAECKSIFLPHVYFVNSSLARNILIAAARLRSEDYVLFPDDDCWYAEGFFLGLSSVIGKNSYDMMLLNFSSNPGKWPPAPQFSAASQVDALRRGNTNCLILQGDVLSRAGNFDDRIGLGTTIGGGEDIDLAIRALKVAKNPTVTKSKLIGHRELNNTLRIKAIQMRGYWPSAMYVTLNHMSFALAGLLAYRLCVGIFLLSTRQLTWTRFLLPFQLRFGRAPQEP